jgi:hypothetical protein
MSASRRTAASRSSSSRTREQTKRRLQPPFLPAREANLPERGLFLGKPYKAAQVNSDSTVVGLKPPVDFRVIEAILSTSRGSCARCRCAKPSQPASRWQAWRGKEPSQGRCLARSLAGPATAIVVATIVPIHACILRLGQFGMAAARTYLGSRLHSQSSCQWRNCHIGSSPRCFRRWTFRPVCASRV